MTAPADLHAAVLARLEPLTTVAVYDSQVGRLRDGSAQEPAGDAAGRAYPYAVLWPTPGWTPGEGRNLEYDAGGALTWDARVTVASGDPTWTLQAVALVRARLDAWPILAGARLTELEGATDVVPDRDTTPPRWFVPLTFRAVT